MQEREDQDYFSSSIELKPKDFSSTKASHLKSKECTIVLYYSPWCGYCKAVKEDWKKLARTALFTNVKAMNCEKNSSHLQKIREELPELVKHFPTIVFYKDGVPMHHQPEEGRDYANLLKACMEFCKGN